MTFGEKAKEAQYIIRRTKALLTGNDLDDDAKDVFFLRIDGGLSEIQTEKLKGKNEHESDRTISLSTELGSPENH